MIQVAGYCRVSTDKEDQANSFASQQSYFRAYISSHPDWRLYEIYADEGVSGTSTRKRRQFHRMIQDAYAGRFQLILTKEVSRFSRNIVDTLSYTRKLRQIGVAVEFMTDHINTMDGDGELRLSIMATLAQDESRKTSSRVVWGQTRQMEKGVVFGRSLLGYEVANGVLTVEPEGAAVVRLIFEKYAREQMGTSELARYLTQTGYRTHRGSSRWSTGAILRILKNEKYAGDLVAGPGADGAKQQTWPWELGPLKPLCVFRKDPVCRVRSQLCGPCEGAEGRHQGAPVELRYGGAPGKERLCYWEADPG